MVRNMVVLGGSAHPELTETICNRLGVPPAKIFLGKFAVGETRVEIQESVRGKDVFIIQSGGGKVNDHLMELLITISACKTASASKVTAVLPLFPYSRQSDVPYNKTGAPLIKGAAQSKANGSYTFDSRPQTPYMGPNDAKALTNGADALNKQLEHLRMNGVQNGTSQSNSNTKTAHFAGGETNGENQDASKQGKSEYFTLKGTNGANPETYAVQERTKPPVFEPQRGYRQWVAQAGTLVADLLTCAGADHVITMDLHDPQYQGFFDIPVDNLYGRHLLRRFIQYEIPNYQQAVIVSPDAGGAKRATAIADALGMPFALIHKVGIP
jgi:ribose-phosphate pyrophosphokinase